MRTLFALIAALLAITQANAMERLDSPTGGPRPFAFGADRPERCDWFLVTEFTASLTGMDTQDAFDRILFTDALGIMRNVDRSRALGLACEAHLADGNIRLVPAVRVRQWLAGRQSLELSVGYASDVLTKEGVVGPVVSLRYGANAWSHVQVGATRIRNVTGITYLPEPRVEETSAVYAHGGVGVGGAGGLIAWGLQAIGFAALVAMMGGMS